MPAPVRWRKSSHSSDSNICVEIAHIGLRMAVRDSKNPTGPTISLPAISVTNLLHSL